MKVYHSISITRFIAMAIDQWKFRISKACPGKSNKDGFLQGDPKQNRTHLNIDKTPKSLSNLL